MSRYASDEYDENFANQSELWWANVERALAGARGQRALADLEAALLALPEPRLVEGRLATADGAVCAVGALALHLRVQAGEDRAAVLAEMARIVPGTCATCWHADYHHPAGGGACEDCVTRNARLEDWNAHAAAGGSGIHHRVAPACEAYVDGGYAEDDSGGDSTARAGVAVGLSYTLAWHLGHLNDEQYGGVSPEVRYELILAWVRRALGRATTAVA